jgi:carboxypeptidase PM20D1
MLFYILLAVLSVIVILFIIALIRSFFIKKECGKGKSYDMLKDGINPNLHAEHLSGMIQIPSVSRRGNNDLTEIYKMHKRLEELYPLIHSKLTVKDIDGALLYKWKGKDSSKAPVLLMSHHDVVEAVGDWKYPPFSGTIADGKIWGRGTVDTKGALCAILESVEYLLSRDFQPERDFYIASSCNEEITGDGAVKTVEYMYEQNIRPELVMDEGGSVMGHMMGCEANCAMVGVLEKGRANVKFIAHSHGGHASIPFRHNPFARLAKLINRVESHPPFKLKITKPVKDMYKAMAPYMPFKYRFLLGNAWLLGPIMPYFMRKMGGQPAALVSTTCVFTMAEGSHGANVIPETATATANMRFMVHEPLEPSLKKMLKIAKKNDIWMEMISGYDIPPTADKKCSAYKKVIKQIGLTFGNIPVVPYVMLAGTDARHYTKICDCVLRFVPLVMTDEQMKSAHAVNENLNVSSLARAVNFYTDFIKSYDRA